MYCENCGRPINDSDKFCYNCGCSIEKNTNVPKAKKGKSKYIIMAISILCVFSGAVLLALNFKDGINIPIIKDIASNNNTDYIAWVLNNDSKYGYINKSGQEIVSCKYDYAEDFENGLAKVGLYNGTDEDGDSLYLYGLINTNGKEIVSCEYDNIEILSENNAIGVEKNNQVSLMDMNGRVIVKTKYNRIYGEVRNSDLIEVEDNDGNYGCINIKGDEIIPCKYLYSMEYIENKELMLVTVHNADSSSFEDHGLVDLNGNEVIPPQEDFWVDKTYKTSDILPVKLNGKYGYMDCQGNVVIPIEYDYASEFGKNGLAIVTKDGNSYIIDKSGNVQSQCNNSYTYVDSFEENGLAGVFDGEYHGFINTKGEEIIPCKYDLVDKIFFKQKSYYFYKNNLAKVIIEEGEDYYDGVIDSSGNEIIPCEYDTCVVFDNDRISVSKNDKYGLFDFKGNNILPLEYDLIIACTEDILSLPSYVYEDNLGTDMIVVKDGKKGLLDKNGKVIFDCIYTDFELIDKNGYFVAYLGEDKTTPVLLNKNGKEIIPEGYEYIGKYGDNGLIPVSQNGKFSCVDEKGNTKLELENEYYRMGAFVECTIEDSSDEGKQDSNNADEDAYSEKNNTESNGALNDYDSEVAAADYEESVSEKKSFDGDVLLTAENIYYKKNDGTVWGKGVNTDGELGNGERTDSTEWTQVLDIYNAKKIFKCSYCYALTTEGDLYRWGNNIFTPEKVDFPEKIIDVTCNADQSSECPPIITCDSGKKYLMSNDAYVELDFENIDNISTISFAGYINSLYYFLLLDGQLYKCEPNFNTSYSHEKDSFEISEKTFTELYEITPVDCGNKKLKGGSSVSTSNDLNGYESYFVDEENGECFKCKFNEENSSLESCGGNNVKTMYISYSSGKNSYDLFNSGDAICAGSNGCGQLGDGTYEDLKEGWKLNDYNFEQLKVVNRSVAAIDENNNVWVWGEYFGNTPEIIISGEDFSY